MNGQYSMVSGMQKNRIEKYKLIITKFLSNLELSDEDKDFLKNEKLIK
jgi:hypothetical protein